jgi:ADP-ribose pyrophosphatase YjhB (NUDIX family)
MTLPAVLKFCPRCGSPDFGAKAPYHHVCAACAFEWFINPAVAAACFVSDEHDQVLLIRRQKDPGKGLLAPPGGFINAGETAEAGVRREVQEETGLSLETVRYLCSQPNTYAYRGYTYNVLDLFFVARVPTFIGVTAGEDVSGFVVLPAAEVEPAVLAFPSMQAAWRCRRNGRSRG